MKDCNLFIGPMSKNITDSVIEYSNEFDISLALIPSRRQVDFSGGYVNNWTTNEFCEYVRSRSKKVLLVRDHCGPSQGFLDDDGMKSFTNDCKNFDIIHVDVWKKHQDYSDGLQETIKFLNYGYELNQNLYYEVGTEESIRKTDPVELENFITDLKKNLDVKIFNRIKYIVIQSGTSLKENINTGSFDQNRLISMIEVARKHNMISKEHNGDYLSNNLINLKFCKGLDCINIAPEFGQIETSVILKNIYINKPELFEDFYEICYKSKRWKKWVSDDFIPNENKENLVNICGHYVFSTEDFLRLKNKMNVEELDFQIKFSIKNKIQNLLKNIKDKC
jgi:hypothetical protein